MTFSSKRIAKNYCLMKRRRSVFAPDREYSLDELLPDADDHALPRFQPSDSGEAPDSRVLRSELGVRIREALAELPDIYRSVVLLRDVEEMTTAEAAEILDVSEDTVKQRLHRGRLALRKALSGYLEVVPGGAR